MRATSRVVGPCAGGGRSGNVGCGRDASIEARALRRARRWLAAMRVVASLASPSRRTLPGALRDLAESPDFRVRVSAALYLGRTQARRRPRGARARARRRPPRRARRRRHGARPARRSRGHRRARAPRERRAVGERQGAAPVEHRPARRRGREPLLPGDGSARGLGPRRALRRTPRADAQPVGRARRRPAGACSRAPRGRGPASIRGGAVVDGRRGAARRRRPSGTCLSSRSTAR